MVVFWPERGLASRWSQMRRMTRRILIDDALKYITKGDLRNQCTTPSCLAEALQISEGRAAELVDEMQADELVTLKGDEVQLTPKGRDYAMHIIRAHRLWERYLAEETGFTETEWHAQAEHYEHLLSPEEADQLSARLGHPTHDPHGDPIPTAEGDVVVHGGVPLNSTNPDDIVRIVHIEDEPAAIYDQLVAEGLHLGMTVRVTESSPERIRFWADGDEHVLAPIIAANLSVLPVTAELPAEEDPGEQLNLLKPGEKGAVLNISPLCRGPERRRLMDLGVLPGTVIKAEMTSPGGDPTAYNIRGALIALRTEQARHIRISRLQETT
jgi:DtxR family Mn-dependent transcriptional regulator